MNREFIYRIWNIQEKKYIMTGSLYGLEGIAHLTCCFNRRYHTIEEYTGLNRLFSGFEKPIIKASKLFGIEYSSLIFELGNRKLVAGQEDLILEVAQKLKK